MTGFADVTCLAAKARHAIGQSHKERQKKRKGGGGEERKSPLVQPPLINSGKMNHGRLFQTHPGFLITSYLKDSPIYWTGLKLFFIGCICGFSMGSHENSTTSSTLKLVRPAIYANMRSWLINRATKRSGTPQYTHTHTHPPLPILSQDCLQQTA